MHMVHYRQMSILQTYLSNAGMTQREFAAKVGVDQSIISRLSKDVNKGGMTPSLDLAFRIQRATRGKVPASSWVADGMQKAV